jgi:hypothetical protein
MCATPPQRSPRGAGQFEFMTPALSYMKTYGLTHEQLAIVSVVQREWAAQNPRAIPGRPALAGRPGDADPRRGCTLWSCVLRDAPKGAPQHEVSISYLK